MPPPGRPRPAHSASLRTAVPRWPRFGQQLQVRVDEAEEAFILDGTLPRSTEHLRRSSRPRTTERSPSATPWRLHRTPSGHDSCRSYRIDPAKRSRRCGATPPRRRSGAVHRRRRSRRDCSTVWPAPSAALRDVPGARQSRTFIPRADKNCIIASAKQGWLGQRSGMSPDSCQSSRQAIDGGGTPGRLQNSASARRPSSCETTDHRGNSVQTQALAGD